MRTRRAFTLVEILIVIGIIVILVGMILPAVQIARRSALRTQAVMDMAQLSLATANARNVNSARYVPSYITIKSTYDMTQAQDAFDWGQLQQFYGPRFGTTPNPATPNIKASGLPNWGVIQGSQCLVLFLGGWNGTVFATGTQATNTPFAAGGSRSTFFDFPVNRLWLPPVSAVPVFVDPFPLNGGAPGTPYAFMTCVNGNDYGNGAGGPAWNPYNPTGTCVITGGTYTNYGSAEKTITIAAATINPFIGPTGQFVSWGAGNVQIISAGPDSTFGPGGAYKPGMYPYVFGAIGGGDDYASFSAWPLGVPVN